MKKIDIGFDEANSLISALIPLHANLQGELYRACAEARADEEQLFETRLKVVDGLISQVLAHYDVEGWDEVRG